MRYTDEALAAAVSLSARYLKDLHLPDKAIDVIDEAGAAKKLKVAPAPATPAKEPAPATPVAAAPAGQSAPPPVVPAAPPAIVDVSDIEAVVAKMARAPVQSVSSDDKTALKNLQEELQRVIFGQDDAIAEVSSAIRLSRSGLRAPDKPIGNFLFAGPTGVGKTELAKQLARVLHIEFLRFDMSEYMEKHAVSRLIGAPPATSATRRAVCSSTPSARRRTPCCCSTRSKRRIPDLFSILLQVMDHATLTDTHGRKADFRHVILIMTTNAGARDLSGRKLGFGESPEGSKATAVLERVFAPEFRNRLDATVHFKPLGAAEIARVVDKHLAELQALVTARNITIALTPAARQWLAARGFDRAFGARPMARLIENAIKKPLSELLLFGEVAPGSTVTVDEEGGAIRLRVGA